VPAREINDTVRLLVAAVRITGPNRTRVGDYLASGATYSGLGGPVSFDKAAILKVNTFYKAPLNPSIRAAF
jgi:hypothetical protein